MRSAMADAREHEAVPESVHVKHGPDGLSSGMAVVEAIADLVGVDPVDLADETGIVLYDHVDPDALDTLVADSTGNDVTVSLTVAGYDIRIDETKVVAQRPAE